MGVPPQVSAVTGTFLAEADARLPDLLGGLFLHGSLCWGEFFPGSDIDFVALWDGALDQSDLGELEEAHRATRDAHPGIVFDGFHCTAHDLAGSPTEVGTLPAFYQGEFDPAGRIGINWVTWHELAERGIAVRGQMPSVHTDDQALRDFTRGNLDTYWRAQARSIEEHGIDRVGEMDDVVVWVVLGAARLHHLLTTRRITSRSGAGRYVLESLEERWHPIATEALRIREQTGQPTSYADTTQRGEDLHSFLVWAVDDGVEGLP